MKFIFVLFVMTSLIAGCADGQRVPVVSLDPPEKQADMWQWTKSAWNDNGNALRTEREQLTKLANKKESLRQIIARCSRDFPKNKDRLTLFRWGYAMYLARSDGWLPDDMAGLPYYISTAKPPYDREFLRMLFLLHSRAGWNKYLVKLGERLAKSDPKDGEVRHAILRVIDFKTEEAKQLGLTYARSLLTLEPDNPRSYAAMAWCYKSRWLLSDQVEDMRESIRWNEEYLKHGGSDPDYDKALRTWVLPNDRKWLAEHTKH